MWVFPLIIAEKCLFGKIGELLRCFGRLALASAPEKGV